MAKAVWNGQVIAEASSTEECDGFVYFPPESVNHAFVEPSDHTSL